MFLYNKLRSTIIGLLYRVLTFNFTKNKCYRLKINDENLKIGALIVFDLYIEI